MTLSIEQAKLSFESNNLGKGFFALHYGVVICLVLAAFFAGLAIKSFPRTRIVTRNIVKTETVKIPFFAGNNIESDNSSPNTYSFFKNTGGNYAMADSEELTQLHLVGTDTNTEVTDYVLTKVPDFGGHAQWELVDGAFVIRVVFLETTYVIYYSIAGASSYYWQKDITPTEPLGSYASIMGSTGTWTVSAQVAATAKKKSPGFNFNGSNNCYSW